MPQQLVTLLMALLVLTATAGLAVLVGASFRQRRRRAGLARVASDLGLRYSREDPFGIPGRYAEFALVGGGHSPAAANVIFGHIKGVAVRAFDFQYEVGHGTRRVTRRYGVVLLETDSPLPRLLMWHNGDFPPIPARQSPRMQGPWNVIGDEKLAAAVIATAGPWFTSGGCVEMSRDVVLLATPGPTNRNNNFPPLPMVVEMVKKLPIM